MKSVSWHPLMKQGSAVAWGASTRPALGTDEIQPQGIRAGHAVVATNGSWMAPQIIGARPKSVARRGGSIFPPTWCQADCASIATGALDRPGRRLACACGLLHQGYLPYSASKASRAAIAKRFWEFCGAGPRIPSWSGSDIVVDAFPVDRRRKSPEWPGHGFPLARQSRETTEPATRPVASGAAITASVAAAAGLAATGAALVGATATATAAAESAGGRTRRGIENQHAACAHRQRRSARQRTAAGHDQRAGIDRRAAGIGVRAAEDQRARARPAPCRWPGEASWTLRGRLRTVAPAAGSIDRFCVMTSGAEVA